ncbi:MAG: HAD family hydrolase [Selenomonadaceae bacterium]|nr:HAD family hydrolase [Selenomonadaceae bacterium]
MKKFRAAIFDMDGTLTDTIEDLRYSMDKMLEHYNFPTITLEQTKKFVGNGARKFLLRSLPEEVADDEILVEEALNFYNEFYVANCTRSVKPYSGIMDMLTELTAKKIPLGICTNKQHGAAVTIAEKILAPIKFAAVSGDEFKLPRKPNPTRALTIAQQIGVAPEEVAYFGDTAVDVDTAINAGFLPVAVTWGFRPRSELVNAKIIVDTPQEILDLINFVR